MASIITDRLTVMPKDGGYLLLGGEATFMPLISGLVAHELAFPSGCARVGAPETLVEGDVGVSP